MEHNRVDINLDSFSRAADTSGYALPGLTEIEKTILGTHLSKPCKTLVIGCGAGRVSIPLWQTGHHVDAFDISERMIEVAQNNVRNYQNIYPKRRINHFKANAVTYDYGEQAYEAIIAPFNSLDYILPINNRKKVLYKVNKALQLNVLFIYSSHIYHFSLNKKSLCYHFINLINLNLLRQRFLVKTHYGKIIRYHGSRQEQEISKNGFHLLEKYHGRNEKHRFKTPWIYYVTRKIKEI